MFALAFLGVGQLKKTVKVILSYLGLQSGLCAAI
jgi:hypothetical protein